MPVGGLVVLEERERQFLGHALLVHPKACAVDVYQSIGRAFVAEEAHIPSLCPGSRIWLIEGGVDENGERSHPRFLLGREALQLQGFSVNYKWKDDFRDV